MAGHFSCVFCEEKVVIDDLNEVGLRLLCSDCDERITMEVIDRIINNTNIPKTYRKIFELYLKWTEERNK